MSVLDSIVAGGTSLAGQVAAWNIRNREAIDDNRPVTITLGYADADRLATLLCRIENVPEMVALDSDDAEEVADLGALATRLFEVVCAATDAALNTPTASGANARSVF